MLNRGIDYPLGVPSIDDEARGSHATDIYPLDELAVLEGQGYLEVTLTD